MTTPEAVSEDDHPAPRLPVGRTIVVDRQNVAIGQGDMSGLGNMQGEATRPVGRSKGLQMPSGQPPW